MPVSNTTSTYVMSGSVGVTSPSVGSQYFMPTGAPGAQRTAQQSAAPTSGTTSTYIMPGGGGSTTPRAAPRQDPTKTAIYASSKTPPGVIDTQPNAKIVFNSPYDNKHIYHIK